MANVLLWLGLTLICDGIGFCVGYIIAQIRNKKSKKVIIKN